MAAIQARHPPGLLQLDPDLGARLSTARARAALGDLRPPVLELPRGAWEAGWPAAPGHLGFLILEGVLAREVAAGDAVSPELLGAGDIARPWALEEPPPLLQLDVSWSVLAEARVAVLDAGFAARLGPYPEVAMALADRLEARAQRLAALHAIGRVGRVDERLVALMWHLADRWGRMSPEGVVVPLSLSHRLLGQLIGSRRPTVTAALSRLADAGRVMRRDDGAWLLAGVPGEAAGQQERAQQRLRHVLIETPAQPPVTRASAVAHDAQAARAESAANRQSMRELTAKIARLREETTERAQALSDVVELASEICRHTGTLRRHRDERLPAA